MTITHQVSTALEVRGVSAGYGATTILRDVSLTLRSGEVTALLGPNGAGKTTLIRAISGEIRPSRGDVQLGGSVVSGQRPEQRVRAGLCTIPEGRGVFPALTVRENLALHAVPDGRRLDALDAALTAFPDLSRRLGQTAGSMSGGQQQMLALARCFTTQPSVVLLDEVSMGLAPRIIDDIFAAIAQLATTGVCLLVVEQYVSRALAMADRVAVLDRGRIALSGAASEISAEDLTERYLSGSSANRG